LAPRCIQRNAYSQLPGYFDVGDIRTGHKPEQARLIIPSLECHAATIRLYGGAQIG